MVTVRLDDISPNTDMIDLEEQIRILQGIEARIILGVSIMSKATVRGSCYPDLPMRGKPRAYFYNVDRLFSMSMADFLRREEGVEVVSHGFMHADHSKLDRDAVEMSILTSCNLLKTHTFIPPFNEVSEHVKSVCAEHGIHIIGNTPETMWRSLETEKFDPAHSSWYYHPWRLNASQLREALA